MSGIAHWALDTPDAPALLTMGGVTTFVELEQRQRLVAGWLRSENMTEGDRVAVLAANRVELLELTGAALRSDVVPVPLDPALSEAAIAYAVEDSGAALLVADRLIETAPELTRVVTFGDAYERCLHDAAPIDIASHTSTRPMHYAPRNSGPPRGVWVAPRSPTDAAASSDAFGSAWGLAPGERHLVCSPLSQPTPHLFATRTLEAGGAVVLRPRFEPTDTLAAVELFGVTSIFLDSAELERIMALKGALMRHDLSSLRLVAHSGSPLPEAIKRRAIELFPQDSVWELYASTEGVATRISSHERLLKPNSVGVPAAGARIVIRAPDGHELPPGETGEVWIEDPSAERFEYWGDPAATAATWRAGAFTTGDLGRVDEDGYLFLTQPRTP